ncbi:MAG: class II aldolase/adducin family protein [Eubacteriales bacterium]
MNYCEMRTRVQETAVMAYQEKLVAGTSGNVSEFDRKEGVMAITPSDLSYKIMKPEDIVIMKLDGEIIEGNWNPSSEWRLHAGIYADMEDVNAVVHTHSPYATSFAVIHENIPVILIEILPFLGGDLRLAKFGLPGTFEVATNAVQAMTNPRRHACLLENHGVAVVGASLEQAYIRAVYVEDAATIYHYARQVGHPKLVSYEAEKELRKRYKLDENKGSVHH